MFSKFSLGIMFVAVLILAGFWFIQKDSDERATENRLSANKKAIVADIKIRKPQQQNKQSIKGKEPKKKKLDRMLTPDELYEQRLIPDQFEVESINSEIEVIPEELKIIEEEATLSSLPSDTLDLDELLDIPGQINGVLQEDELPPSENYEEVVPFELEQMESQFDTIEEN